MTDTLSELDVLVGAWKIEPRFAEPASEAVVGRAVFEWMTGGRLLVQRWEVPHPDAPDGLAIIGAGPDGEGYLQHYFDSRGVVRVYAMTMRDRVWGLLRVTPDFSPLDFSQRFVGQISEDGGIIDGRWEISRDGGAGWKLDFELIYTKVQL
jgi:hypothetical protein